MAMLKSGSGTATKRYILGTGTRAFDNTFLFSIQQKAAEG